MADEKTIIMTPENTTPAYPAFGGLGNGFGSFNSIADLFGLAIIASMFGWGYGSRGGYGMRGGYGNRYGEREMWDEMEDYGERRRRDSRGRYM